MPLHLIGDLSRATFDNAEQLKITFVDSTIRPLCEMIEKSFNHRLLNADEQEKYYFKFNLAGLLRGDMKSRFEAYNIGRNIGVYSANDIRKLEDLNEIENGDIYLQPLNMDEAGSSENSDPAGREQNSSSENSGSENSKNLAGQKSAISGRKRFLKGKNG